MSPISELPSDTRHASTSPLDLEQDGKEGNLALSDGQVGSDGSDTTVIPKARREIRGLKVSKEHIRWQYMTWNVTTATRKV